MLQNPFETDAKPVILTQTVKEATLGNKSNNDPDDTEYRE
jgi:hypothetical protein